MAPLLVFNAVEAADVEAEDEGGCGLARWARL
jgi:hypothetical protein